MYYCAKLGNILRKTNPECFLYPHYRDYTEGNKVLTFISEHGGRATVPMSGRASIPCGGKASVPTCGKASVHCGGRASVP